MWLSPYAADFRMLLGYNVMKNVYVTQYTSDINVFWLAFFRPDVLELQCSLKGPLTCTKLFTAALRRYIFRTFTFSCLAPLLKNINLGCISNGNALLVLGFITFLNFIKVDVDKLQFFVLQCSYRCTALLHNSHVITY